MFSYMCVIGIAYRSLGFANYHLNIFAFSWVQMKRANGFKTWKKKKPKQKPRSFAEE